MTCRICGRQCEVSDSGQPMPCICIKRPSDAFLLDCVADCVGPAAPEEPKPRPGRCAKCGHPKSMHDTGWDAAGCMVDVCTCRCWEESEEPKR